MTDDRINAILDEISKVIVGKQLILKRVLASLLANGHILFHDVPGLAKTMMARSFSMVLGLSYNRISFTPDLLPADITGVSIFNIKNNEFEFKKGPIHCSLLLADEINRASPKTQSALLEAMQEKTLTIDGHTYQLGPPFIVMATENPLEFEGTFPLPEAQLDRFLMKTTVGYPSYDDEIIILQNRIARKKEDFNLKQILSANELANLQNEVENVTISQPIIEYIVKLVSETRNNPKISVGSSPRGSLGLLSASKSWAYINGRNFVNPQDVQDVFIPVMAHRIILRSGDLITGITSESVLDEILEKITAPRIE
ncbi:MAG: MoxR family ATPase [Asgard group archaeon]|jgi:MoxR-like ATPase|nr:magnesium chelatase [Candidatus Heimdallarchaeota archaeon]MEC8704717.1 MoxR family ATPase [Asgard group archaeon]|tara:strand:+ start:217 stop:1155 length:939 start_codon:yes stop_codon:yes gene_type:complete